jgi:adenosylhomocysteine nucleosidase
VADALPNVLLVMALEIESQGLFERERIPVLYSGLGKVNATFALTRRLHDYRKQGRDLPLVVNFGTAGSRRFSTHSTVACRAFVQRDMDVTGLGFALGQTPFDPLPERLEFPALFSDLPEGVCGSGDRFVTSAPEIDCDVIDMEAYALAKVCRLEGARFGCAKFISDGADHGAAGDWQSSLPKAAQAFLELYRTLPSR